MTILLQAELGLGLAGLGIFGLILLWLLLLFGVFIAPLGIWSNLRKIAASQDAIARALQARPFGPSYQPPPTETPYQGTEDTWAPTREAAPAPPSSDPIHSASPPLGATERVDHPTTASNKPARERISPKWVAAFAILWVAAIIAIMVLASQ